MPSHIISLESHNDPEPWLTESHFTDEPAEFKAGKSRGGMSAQDSTGNTVSDIVMTMRGARWVLDSGCWLC